MLDNLYTDIGDKIKKWAAWIFIVEAIGAIIAGISMMVTARDIDTPSFTFGVLSIIVGPFVAWVSSWLLYAFGQLVDDTHAIRTQTRTIDRNLQTMAQPMIDEADKKAKHEANERAMRQAETQSKREAEEKAKREAEEKAKREAKEKAKREAEKKVEQLIQKKEKTLSEKLTYALMFQSDEGMISYLNGIQDETVQKILKSPQHLVREQIENLLASM